MKNDKPVEYAEHIKKRLREPENSIETWRQKVKDDPEYVRKLLKSPLIPVRDVWHISARKALEEYDQEQRDSLISQQKEREQKQDHREVENSSVAKRTLNWTAIAVLVGCIGAVLAYKALAN